MADERDRLRLRCDAFSDDGIDCGVAIPDCDLVSSGVLRSLSIISKHVGKPYPHIVLQAFPNV